MKFLGIGSALPKKVVSNDDLAQVMDTSDEWRDNHIHVRGSGWEGS